MMIYNLGNRAVNNYLITGKEGHILIDTGYAGGFRRFQRKIKKAGIDPKDIKFVFLTHAHDDHAGYLNDILAVSDAKVIMHPRAVARLKRGQNSFEGGCSSRLAYLFCLLLSLIGRGEHRYPPIKEEYLARIITIDSDEFRTIGFPFKVIETPGHTADHISLIKDNIMFCGDAAMNGFPSIRRVIIWIEDLQQFRHSWGTILEAGPGMIYPAHGKPFPASDLKKYYSSLDKIKLYPLKTG